MQRAQSRHLPVFQDSFKTEPAVEDSYYDALDEDIDWEAYEDQLDHTLPEKKRSSHEIRQQTSGDQSPPNRDMQKMLKNMELMQDQLEQMKKDRTELPSQQDHQRSFAGQHQFSSQLSWSPHQSGEYDNSKTTRGTPERGFHTMNWNKGKVSTSSKAPVFDSSLQKNGITLKPVTAIRELKCDGCIPRSSNFL